MPETLTTAPATDVSTAGSTQTPPVVAPQLVQAPARTPGADRPRNVSRGTLDDRASLYGSAAAALALVWVIFEGLLGWTGVIGFVLCWWITFLVLYAAVSSLSNPLPIVLDRVAGSVVTSGAAVIIGAVVATLWSTAQKGWPALHHWNFFTQDMAGVRPTAPLNEGGISHAIIGSVIEVGIAIAIALPLGVGTAVYMTEMRGRLATAVRTVIEAMTALPDILAGLFIYAVFIIGFHWSRTGLTAALALSVTAIPIIARSAEVVLRVVPGGLREASLALGASQWQTVRRVVLPTARPGLATALILGIARIAGETAPLLIVSGDSTFWNVHPLQDPMNSLPLFIMSSIKSGQPMPIVRAYGAAIVLLVIVFALFAIARFIARPKAGRK